MGFIKKSVQSEQSFGLDLKELRELRGWSQAQLSQVSGIPEYIITAFEKEEFSLLNDPLYSQRHLRTLIKALDGRVPFFIGKYRAALELKGHDLNNQTKNYSFTHKVKRSEFFTPTKYLSFLIIIPIFILLGFYVWNEARIFRESPTLELISPKNNEEITTSRLIVQGRTNPNASVLINGVNAVVEQDGTFAMTLDIPRGLTKIEVTAKRRYGIENSISRYVTFAPIQGPLPPDTAIKYYQTYTTSTSPSTTTQ